MAEERFHPILAHCRSAISARRTPNNAFGSYRAAVEPLLSELDAKRNGPQAGRFPAASGKDSDPTPALLGRGGRRRIFSGRRRGRILGRSGSRSVVGRSGRRIVVGRRRGGDTLAEQSRSQQSKDDASHNERFANCEPGGSRESVWQLVFLALML